jgi:hypothetical protein
MAVVAYLPCWPARPVVSSPLRAAVAAVAASWLCPLPLCRTLGRAVVAVVSKGHAALALPPIPSTRPDAPASAVASCCCRITALSRVILIAPALLDGPVRACYSTVTGRIMPRPSYPSWPPYGLLPMSPTRVDASA